MNVLEKILEEIDEEIKEQCLLCKDIKDTPGYRLYVKTMKRAKDIIEKYLSDGKDTNVLSNNGWIPVEERLPEVSEGLADEYCSEFNVTIKGAERATTLKYSWDGTWFDDSGNVYDVIAWQPLPEPYKPK